MINLNQIGISKIDDDICLQIVKQIEDLYPQQTYYQQDYMNVLYTKELSYSKPQIQKGFLENPTVHYLLTLKIEDIENPFDEKQNDTADILVVKDNFYELIDIKTRNISKSAQPPNIISAYKMAQLCAKMIDINPKANSCVFMPHIEHPLR